MPSFVLLCLGDSVLRVFFSWQIVFTSLCHGIIPSVFGAHRSGQGLVMRNLSPRAFRQFWELEILFRTLLTGYGRCRARADGSNRRRGHHSCTLALLERVQDISLSLCPGLPLVPHSMSVEDGG